MLQSTLYAIQKAAGIAVCVCGIVCGSMECVCIVSVGQDYDSKVERCRAQSAEVEAISCK